MKRKMLMRKMNKFCKAFALGAMLAMALPMAAKAVAFEEVAIDKYHFPDEAFREYVRTSFDLNGNGTLENLEIWNARSVVIPNKNIAELTGIKYLKHMDSLVCDHNRIEKLDLTENPYLVYLKCNNNQLKELKLDDNLAIVTFDCSSNQLSELDFEKLVYTKNIDCSNNRLTSLNVSNNKKLKELNCSDNGLKSLNLTENNKLEKLKCSGMLLKQLNLIQNTELIELDCSSNELTKLNLSKCVYLKSIYCSENKIGELKLPNTKYARVSRLMCHDNELTQLDLSGLPLLQGFSCNGNHLWCLDISQNPSVAFIVGANQTIEFDTDEDKTIDLSSVAGMDVSKISNVKNATLKGQKLIVKASPVSYDYALMGEDVLNVVISTKVHTHTTTMVPEKMPTCGEDGNNQYYTCECGKWFWDEESNREIVDHSEVLVRRTENHAYDEGVIESEPTCEKEGKKVYTCQDCGIQTQENIASLNHVENTKMIRASLSENGRITTICQVCHKQLSKVVIYHFQKAVVKENQISYNGKKQIPIIEMYDVKGNLIPKKYGQIIFPNSVKVGTYTAEIKLRGLYTGKVKAKYVISPANTKIASLKAGKKEVLIAWEKRAKEVTGYEIQYSTDSHFAKNVTKTSKVSSYKKTKQKITGLKQGKTYYFRIRTYKRIASKNYYSQWSKVEKVKIR